jgi:hypothetical protein
MLYGAGFLMMLAIGMKVASTGGETKVREGEGALAATSVQRGPDGTRVRVDAATRKRIGLQVSPLAGVELPDIVHGFGRLLDPTALVTPVYEYEAAHVAFEAADREYRRVQTLRRGNANASERDLEAARTGYERDRAAMRTAQSHLASAWGSQAVAHRDLSALAQSLVTRETAVARIDLPLGTTLSGEPATGRVVALANADSSRVDAMVLGAAADSDPTIQGRGFLLLVERPPWPPGTALDGWLTVPGRSRTGVDVPSSAVLRYGMASYVYVQTDDETFSRRAVRLDQPTKDGWFVTNGLAAGDSVVVTGAQQLLSTELGGAAEGD